MRAVLSAAIALAMALPAMAEAPAVDFDQAIDVQQVLSQAKEKASQMPEDPEFQVQYRTDRDCVNFRFKPEGPTVSEAVWLRSTEYRERCTPVGDPQHGGGQHCWEEPWMTYRERVQVELVDRAKLFPWENEVFQVCLDGPWLHIYDLAVAHDYKADLQGGYFTLTARKRIPMAPDKNGIKAADPVVKGDNLVFGFADKWAEYYKKGEKVEFSLTLKRVIEGWFDPTLVKETVTFDAAEDYTVDFAKYASEFSEALKPGKKYYVEWGFKRIGKVSKPTYMKKGDSPSVEYKPQLRMVKL